MVVSSHRPPARHGRGSHSTPRLDPVLVGLIERRLRAAIPSNRTVEHEDSDDLRQAAWLRLLERLERFENRSTIETFATGVAFHVVREKITRAVRRRRLEERFAVDLRGILRGGEPEDVIDDALTRQERGARVERILSALPDRDRFILRARADEETGFGEILPDFRRLFGDRIATEAGLRTLHRKACNTLRAKLRER